MSTGPHRDPRSPRALSARRALDDARTLAAPLGAILLGLGLGCTVADPSYLGPASSTSGPEDSATDSASASGTSLSPGTQPTGSDTPTSADQGDASDTSDTSDPCTSWWDTGWAHRRRVSFDNRGQPEDLLDFTVLVSLDDTNFDYAQAQPDGADLRFVDEDGTTVLAHHIEQWSPGGQSTVWVHVSQIDASSASDHIWLYYGNDSAADTSDAPGSFDDHYVGVWHLDETSGSHLDSATGIMCTWLGGGDGTQDATGWVSGANDFDGVEDSVNCGNDHIADTGDATITAWIRVPLVQDNNQAVVSVESVSSPFAGISIYVRRMSGAIGTWTDNSYSYASSDANRVNPDEWTFIAIRSHRSMTRGIVQVSKNGGEWETIQSGNTDDLRIEPNTQLVLGKWPGSGPSSNTRGIIDEVRISNVMRDDAWVRAHYLSTTGALSSVGDAEDVCP